MTRNEILPPMYCAHCKAVWYDKIGQMESVRQTPAFELCCSLAKCVRPSDRLWSYWCIYPTLSWEYILFLAQLLLSALQWAEICSQRLHHLPSFASLWTSLLHCLAWAVQISLLAANAVNNPRMNFKPGWSDGWWQGRRDQIQRAKWSRQPAADARRLTHMQSSPLLWCWWQPAKVEYGIHYSPTILIL